jgi:acetolactate synthase-1/2/3 large subunit
MKNLLGSEILVMLMQSLEIEYIFCVPGASIDPILNTLYTYKSQGKKVPELVICQHESTAGYMANGYAKATNKPAILLVTAGPGVTNAISAVATAFSEHVPMIVIGGQVKQSLLHRNSHQGINAKTILGTIVVDTAEVMTADDLAEVFIHHYQKVSKGKKGPSFLSIPSNILNMTTDFDINSYVQVQSTPPVQYAGSSNIENVVALIEDAKNPLFVLGSSLHNQGANEIFEKIIERTHIPCVATFEGNNYLPVRNDDLWYGRLGTFRNHLANKLLENADLIITIGYNIADVDPSGWNIDPNKNRIIHFNNVQATFLKAYHPVYQVLGNLNKNLTALDKKLRADYVYTIPAHLKQEQKKLYDYINSGRHIDTVPVHPLRVLHELNQVIGNHALTLDVGTHQFWVGHYFRSHNDNLLMTSMGFQTMGVALPYAIAYSLAHNKAKVYSISGDGSFLMSSMELSVAVGLNLPVVHIVWKDYTFNLVKVQEENKYGNDYGSNFSNKNVDYAKYAESMGAIGIAINTIGDLSKALERASTITDRPVVIDVLIDYSDTRMFQ